MSIITPVFCDAVVIFPMSNPRVEVPVLFMITVLIELLIFYAISYNDEVLLKNFKKLVNTIILVNVLSFPLAIFVIYVLDTLSQFSYNQFVLAVEIILTLFEGLIIFQLNKKILNYKKSLTISFLMNLASYFIGSIMPQIIL